MGNFMRQGIVKIIVLALTAARIGAASFFMVANYEFIRIYELPMAPFVIRIFAQIRNWLQLKQPITYG